MLTSKIHPLSEEMTSLEALHFLARQRGGNRSVQPPTSPPANTLDIAGQKSPSCFPIHRPTFHDCFQLLPKYQRRARSIEVLEDPCISGDVKKKLPAIRMSRLNFKRTIVARTLNVSAVSVTNYIKMYADGVLPGILENRCYPSSSAIESIPEGIKTSLDDEPVSTAKAVASRIEKFSGVLSEAEDGKRQVFFVDASHFALGAFLGMIWWLSRVFIHKGSGRQRYNVLGAVETRDHDLFTISHENSSNAETICALMEKIDLRYPEEEITHLMDNARYQHNKMVKQLAYEKGIEILYLPPYSPNLNLIERVWGLVKKQ